MQDFSTNKNSETSIIHSFLFGIWNNQKIIFTLIFVIIFFGVYSFLNSSHSFYEPSDNNVLKLTLSESTLKNTDNIKNKLEDRLRNNSLVLNITNQDSSNSNYHITFKPSVTELEARSSLLSEIQTLGLNNDNYNLDSSEYSLSTYPIRELLLISHINNTDLSEISEQIKNIIETASNKLYVEEIGESDEKIIISIDPKKLQSIGITYNELSNQIKNHSGELFIQNQYLSQSNYIVIHDATTNSIEEIRKQLIHHEGITVPLYEIADVQFMSNSESSMSYQLKSEERKNSILLRIFEYTPINSNKLDEIINSVVNFTIDYPQVSIKEFSNKNIISNLNIISIIASLLISSFILSFFTSIKKGFHRLPTQLTQILINVCLLLTFKFVTQESTNLSFWLGVLLSVNISFVFGFKYISKSNSIQEYLFNKYKEWILFLLLLISFSFLSNYLGLDISREFLPVMVGYNFISLVSSVIFDIPLNLYFKDFSFTKFFINITPIIFYLIYLSLSGYIIFSNYVDVIKNNNFWTIDLRFLILKIIVFIVILIGGYIFFLKNKLYSSNSLLENKTTLLVTQIYKKVIKIYNHLLNRYEKLIRYIIFNNKLSALIIIISIIFTFILGFLPLLINGNENISKLDKNTKLYINLIGPENWKVSEIEEKINIGKDIILQTSEVKSFTGISGYILLPQGKLVKDENSGIIIADFVEPIYINRDVNEILSEIESELESILNISIRVNLSNSQNTELWKSSKISIKGNEPESINKAKEDLLENIEQNPYVDSFPIESVASNTYLKIRFNEEAIKNINISNNELNKLIKDILIENPLGKIEAEGEKAFIYIKLADANIEDLSNVEIKTSQGKYKIADLYELNLVSDQSIQNEYYSETIVSLSKNSSKNIAREIETIIDKLSQENINVEIYETQKTFRDFNYIFNLSFILGSVLFIVTSVLMLPSKKTIVLFCFSIFPILLYSLTSFLDNGNSNIQVQALILAILLITFLFYLTTARKLLFEVKSLRELIVNNSIFKFSKVLAIFISLAIPSLYITVVLGGFGLTINLILFSVYYVFYFLFTHPVVTYKLLTKK